MEFIDSSTKQDVVAQVRTSRSQVQIPEAEPPSSSSAWFSSSSGQPMTSSQAPSSSTPEDSSSQTSEVTTNKGNAMLDALKSKLRTDYEEMYQQKASKLDRAAAKMTEKKQAKVNQKIEKRVNAYLATKVDEKKREQEEEIKA